MLSPMLLGLGWFSSVLFCRVTSLIPQLNCEVTVAHGGVAALCSPSNVSGCLSSIGNSHLQSMRLAEEEFMSCVHLLLEDYTDGRFG